MISPIRLVEDSKMINNMVNDKSQNINISNT